MKIYPVILPISDRSKSGRESIAIQRKVALEALRLSAYKQGIILQKLEKDEWGAPLPCEGNYWSISHKPSCVAAVVASCTTGIDIEEIKERSASLFHYVVSEEEWEIIGQRDWTNFYRVWTAKESALKLAGIGIRGLSACRIMQVIDDHHIRLNYKEQMCEVAQCIYKNHVTSVIKNDCEVEWIIPS
ncbi:MAG: 4'-phosphopantetheinyl transferase family protein [bacterium]